MFAAIVARLKTLPIMFYTHIKHKTGDRLIETNEICMYNVVLEKVTRHKSLK